MKAIISSYFFCFFKWERLNCNSRDAHLEITHAVKKQRMTLKFKMVLLWGEVNWARERFLGWLVRFYFLTYWWLLGCLPNNIYLCCIFVQFSVCVFYLVKKRFLKIEYTGWIEVQVRKGNQEGVLYSSLDEKWWMPSMRKWWCGRALNKRERQEA